MSIPSLRALRAFAEVARAGSLAEAARGLHVTPSAVSHLLRDLEAALGFALFSGRGPGAPLSEPGARLARRLGGAASDVTATGERTCRLETHADTLEWLALRLILSGCEFEVHQPPELTGYLLALGARLTRAAGN